MNVIARIVSAAAVQAHGRYASNASRNAQLPVT